MKKKYLKFNWKKFENLRSSEVVSFLKEFHDKPLTEDQFVVLYRDLKQYSTAKRRKGKLYGVSKSRKQYRNWKDTFGFFNPK